MAYFTKAEARAAARSVTASQMYRTSAQILNESRVKARDTESFDIFLSHSISDGELVLGVKRLLEQSGFTVYVDWDTDSQLDRSTVSAATADLLRKRMKQSKSLLYLATESASSSKWMPWELGYFDGHRGGQVAVMPLTDNENDYFSGQEYLGLYPKVTKDTYADTNQKDVLIKGDTNWATLREFGRGMPTWRAYRRN